MIFAILIILCLAPIVFKVDLSKCILPKEGSLSIRGILASLIVLHHCALHTNIPVFYPLMAGIGVWICGIFFIQSGYALYSKIEEYSKWNFLQFYQHRIKRLLVDFISIAVLNILVTLVFGLFDIHNMIHMITKGRTEMILPNSWFIIELIIFYIFSFFAIKTPHYITLITIFVCAMILTFNMIGFGTQWYLSAICFPIGVILKFFEVNNRVIITPPRILCITFVFVALSKLFDNMLFLISSYAMVSVAISVYASIIHLKSKILDFLSSISLHVYMLHSIVIYPTKKYIHNDFAYIGCVIALTVLLCFLFYYIKRAVSRHPKK